MHEGQMHKENCVLTLTYNDENVPKWDALNHEDFQVFIRALRDHVRYALKNKPTGGLKQSSVSTRKTAVKVRYYMAGEYGTKLGRPHYHACIFGVDFADKYPWEKSPSGNQLYRSATLEKLWTKGTAKIGDLSYESAAYIARYIMKKITGERAKEHYVRILVDGTMVPIPPEYNRMSLRPGIGKTWFQKYKKDVYNNGQGSVVYKGRYMTPPKYYDRLLEESDPKIFEQLKAARKEVLKTEAFKAEQTPSRRKARETVALARLSTKPRTLE